MSDKPNIVRLRANLVQAEAERLALEGIVRRAVAWAEEVYVRDHDGFQPPETARNHAHNSVSFVRAADDLIGRGT